MRGEPVISTENADKEQPEATNDILTLRRPDDWHVHLRDNAMLAFAADYTARQFARAIVMPNLVPPFCRAGKVAN